MFLSKWYFGGAIIAIKGTWSIFFSNLSLILYFKNGYVKTPIKIKTILMYKAILATALAHTLLLLLKTCTMCTWVTFLLISQMIQISAFKSYMHYEKIMNFLLIPKSQNLRKFEKKSLKYWTTLLIKLHNFWGKFVKNWNILAFIVLSTVSVHTS